MRIQNNVPALAAYRNLWQNSQTRASALERLSSGFRINRAADDAAGLAISEGLRAQIGGSKVAIRNASDGISVVQTAEGALAETEAILQRMRTLAVQANNGSYGPQERADVQIEFGQLSKELDRIAGSTQFNGQPLLDGSFHDKDFQVGSGSGDTLSISITSGYSAAVPSRTAAAAWWDTYQHLPAAGSTLTFTQNGSAATASVTLPSAPASVTDLAAALNADPSFSASFTASFGFHEYADGARVEDANLIVKAKDPGAGSVVATGLTGSVQSIPGADAQPERYAGFSAADLLVAVDVSSVGGSTTTTTTGGYTGLGVRSDIPTTTTITYGSGAEQAMSAIDAAIVTVSGARGRLGANQNRFEHTLASLGVTTENLTAAESRIRDTDYAEEAVRSTRAQILTDSAKAMLAQANTLPRGILDLLK